MSALRDLGAEVDFKLDTDTAIMIIQDLALDFWLPETIAERYGLTRDQLMFWLARPTVTRMLKEARSFYTSGAGLREKVQLTFMAGLDRAAPTIFRRMVNEHTSSADVASLIRESRQLAFGDTRTQQGGSASTFAVNISIGGERHTTIEAQLSPEPAAAA